MADKTPSGSSNSSDAGPPRIHRVRLGDTLSHLAMNYGVSVETLVAVNHIQDARLLWIGQVLTIPGVGMAAGVSHSQLKFKPNTEALNNGIESKSEDVHALGLVCWDGSPRLQLRASPSTQDDNVIASLAFNTRIQVVKQLTGKWLKITTQDGHAGYVFADHIWHAPHHPLPEPCVRLYRVPAGVAGTAIAIAETHFKKLHWGQDLRFYVALLALVNKRAIPRKTNGWREGSQLPVRRAHLGTESGICGGDERCGQQWILLA